MKKISELNESLQNKYDNPLNLPPVESLGDGVFEGALWGQCFAHEGKKYFCKTGTLNIFPYKVSVVIKNGEVENFNQLDEYQHPELKKNFEQ